MISRKIRIRGEKIRRNSSPPRKRFHKSQKLSFDYDYDDDEISNGNGTDYEVDSQDMNTDYKSNTSISSIYPTVPSEYGSNDDDRYNPNTRDVYVTKNINRKKPSHNRKNRRQMF